MAKDYGLIFSAEAIRENGGLTVIKELDPEFFTAALDAPAGVKKASIDLVFSVVDTSLLLAGLVKADLNLECARCGGLFTAQFSEAFDEVYEDAVQSIDVSLPLTESVALMMPLKPLCATGCKGLCRTCGENLNLKACGCRAEHGTQFRENGKENPFRALKGIIRKKHSK